MDKKSLFFVVFFFPHWQEFSKISFFLRFSPSDKSISDNSQRKTAFFPRFFNVFFKKTRLVQTRARFFTFGGSWVPLGDFMKSLKSPKVNHGTPIFFFGVSCRREAIFFKKLHGAYTKHYFLVFADVPKAPNYLPPEVRFTCKKTWFSTQKKQKILKIHGTTIFVF